MELYALGMASVRGGAPRVSSAFASQMCFFSQAVYQWPFHLQISLTHVALGYACTLQIVSPTDPDIPSAFTRIFPIQLISIR